MFQETIFIAWGQTVPLPSSDFVVLSSLLLGLSLWGDGNPITFIFQSQAFKKIKDDTPFFPTSPTAFLFSSIPSFFLLAITSSRITSKITKSKEHPSDSQTKGGGTWATRDVPHLHVPKEPQYSLPPPCLYSLFHLYLGWKITGLLRHHITWLHRNIAFFLYG